MKKVATKFYMCMSLNAHLKISFTWEKSPEIDSYYYNNIVLISNEVKIQIV